MRLNLSIISALTLLLFACRSSLFHHDFRPEKKVDIPGIYPHKSTDSISVVMFVHGMGRKDQNYPYYTINKMAKKSLGAGYKIEKCTDFYHDNEDIKPQLEKFVAESTNKEKKMIFYSLRYSNFSDTIKDSMKANESIIDRKFRRGLTARVAKDGFIDQFKDVMKVQETEVMKKLINYYDLVMTDAENNYFINSDSIKINLITSSLGSAVTAAFLYDFYLNIAKASFNPQLKTNFDHKAFHFDKKTQRKKYFFTVYQLTNQLILFDKSIRNWGNDKQFEEQELSPTDKNAMSSRFDLRIYSFRNPKDLLCFYVPPTFYQDLFKDYENVHEVINIHYKNMIGHNNIITAHIHPLNSKRIAKTLSEGVHRK